MRSGYVLLKAVASNSFFFNEQPVIKAKYVFVFFSMLIR